jgi:hypothetical protein
MTARQPDIPRRGGRAGWTVADGWLLLALLCFVAGAITLIVTWYKISGLALIAEQLPYLASGGLGGLALVIAGAGCLSAGRSARIEARLVELLSIATEPVTGPAGSADLAGPPQSGATVGAESDSTVLTVTGGTTYHRPDCRLVAGKETSTLPLSEATGQGLTPCPVCH